jgi:DNA-3-methyladenine glycosylase II
MPYAAAAEHLSQADPKMARLIERFGVCGWKPYERSESVFEYLARSIVFQQLNGKVASSIYRRYARLFDPGTAEASDAPDYDPWRGLRHPKPEEVAAAEIEFLRSAGLSPQKASYIKGLALQVLNGLPGLNQLAALDDEQVIAELTRVKGIGRWTVEMLLLFRMGRMDVWPVDDLGVRNGLRRFHGLEAPPKPRQAQEMGEIWRPYRSAAAYYMWELADAALP